MATYTENVVVTQQDIEAAMGERDSVVCLAKRCPIAHAVRRAHPTWAVGSRFVFHERSHRHIATLPDEAIQFIAAFDGDAPVEPLLFSITYNSSATERL